MYHLITDSWVSALFAYFDEQAEAGEVTDTVKHMTDRRGDLFCVQLEKRGITPSETPAKSYFIGVQPSSGRELSEQQATNRLAEPIIVETPENVRGELPDHEQLRQEIRRSLELNRQRRGRWQHLEDEL